MHHIRPTNKLLFLTIELHSIFSKLGLLSILYWLNIRWIVHRKIYLFLRSFLQSFQVFQLLYLPLLFSQYSEPILWDDIFFLLTCYRMHEHLEWFLQHSEPVRSIVHKLINFWKQLHLWRYLEEPVEIYALDNEMKPD